MTRSTVTIDNLGQPRQVETRARLKGAEEHPRWHRLARVLLPTPHRHIDILRIPIRARPGRPFCGDQNGAAATERINHQTAPPRAILDRAGDQGDRLNRRMLLELLKPSWPERIHAGVVPYIAPVTSVLAELDIVFVRALARLPYAQQPMLSQNPKIAELANDAIALGLRHSSDINNPY